VKNKIKLILFVAFIAPQISCAETWKVRLLDLSDDDFPFHHEENGEVEFGEVSVEKNPKQRHIPAILLPEGSVLLSIGLIDWASLHQGWDERELLAAIQKVMQKPEQNAKDVQKEDRFYSMAMGRLIVEVDRELHLCSFCTNEKGEVVCLLEKLLAKIEFNGSVYFIGKYEEGDANEPPKELNGVEIKKLYAMIFSSK